MGETAHYFFQTAEILLTDKDKLPILDMESRMLMEHRKKRLLNFLATLFP